MTQSAAAPSTVAHLLVDALRKLEIDTLFCIPGVQNDDFFNVLLDARDIQPIVCRHEQGTAYMAMGASQASGKPSAACVVPGPGLLNAAGAIYSAFWGGSRVLQLVGGIPTGLAGKHTGVLHDLDDPTAILHQLTSHAAAITSGDRAVETVQAAINALLTNDPRPVSIETPVDLWTAPVDGHLTAPQMSWPTPTAGAIEQAAAALANAKQPLILVGSGAYEASAEVTALAERLRCPVFTRRQGHGVVDARHPLWCPLTVGFEFWKTADVVIGIGSRMEWPLMDWGTDDDMTIIQVNTDEAELDRHGLGILGVHANAAPAMQAILDALPSTTSGADQTDLIAQRRADFDQATAHLEPQRSYLGAVRDVLPDDGVIVEDVTQMGFAAHLIFEFRQPRTFLTSGAAGTLGAGVAQAIGAQVGAGSRPVVGLIGDGGFLFTATELATAVQHNIPVTIALFNNNAYGNVKRIQQERFGADRNIASDLVNPDFMTFGESFGVHTQRVDSPTDFRTALEAAVGHDGPSLVVVELDKVSPNPWPFLRGIGQARGKTVPR